jgi:iron-sulfur cluster repair protein YtfE (RIC family)
MSELMKLREEHAQLAEIVGRLSKFIAQPHPPAASELFKLRHELSSTLIAHLKAEDWVLYPRLFHSADAKVAETARAFADEMGGLAAAYTAYADKWTASSIDHDWAGYCAETRGIIEALTCRITRENRDLYPLAEAIDKAA